MKGSYGTTYQLLHFVLHLMKYARYSIGDGIGEPERSQGCANQRGLISLNSYTVHNRCWTLISPCVIVLYEPQNIEIQKELYINYENFYINF